MNKIYSLMHSYDDAAGEPEDKILGYFATRDEAEGAISHFVELPGFRQHPNGFLVEELQLGRLAWVDGFETVSANGPKSD